MPKTIAVLLLMLSATLTRNAGTIHVPSDFPTIQEAVNVSADGDTVLVAPGDYNEHTLLVTKGVTILSDGAPIQLGSTADTTTGLPSSSLTQQRAPRYRVSP